MTGWYVTLSRVSDVSIMYLAALSKWEVYQSKWRIKAFLTQMSKPEENIIKLLSDCTKSRLHLTV